MHKPDQETEADLKRFVREQGRIVKWLDDWADMELHKLPKAVDNIATQQGRTQVLMELRELFKRISQL